MQLFFKDASDKTLQKKKKKIPICSWKIFVLLTDTGKFENSFPVFWRVGCTEPTHLQTAFI